MKSNQNRMDKKRFDKYLFIAVILGFISLKVSFLAHFFGREVFYWYSVYRSAFVIQFFYIQYALSFLLCGYLFFLGVKLLSNANTLDKRRVGYMIIIWGIVTFVFYLLINELERMEIKNPEIFHTLLSNNYL